MAGLTQISAAPQQQVRHILRLQIITIVWMLIECGVALTSSWRAHSPALLAFGSDSFVELLSAFVVLLPFVASFKVSEHQAARWAGILLFLLAALVTVTSVAALVLRVEPDASLMGIGITAAALIAMPILSAAKRRAAYATNNRALAADAVQSATCAYLAGVTLAGLAINALVHIRWIDPLAALIAVPIICREALRAWKGQMCQCC